MTHKKKDVFIPRDHTVSGSKLLDHYLFFMSGERGLPPMLLLCWDSRHCHSSVQRFKTSQKNFVLWRNLNILFIWTRENTTYFSFFLLSLPPHPLKFCLKSFLSKSLDWCCHLEYLAGIFLHPIEKQSRHCSYSAAVLLHTFHDWNLHNKR